MGKIIKANRLPIDFDIIFEFPEDFLLNLKQNIHPATIHQYINLAQDIPPTKHKELSSFSNTYQISDIKGNPKDLDIIAFINPHQQDITQYKKGKTDLIQITIGQNAFDHIAYNFSHNQDPNIIQDYIAQALTHELTHAQDVIPSNKKIEKLFKDHPDFHFFSREEVKAYINETIYDLAIHLQSLTPEEIKNISFNQLQQHSNIIKQMKEKTSPKPGDDQINIPGGSIKKRKEKAWRTYILTILKWFQKQQERINAL